jgi:hypothetical protein
MWSQIFGVGAIRTFCTTLPDHVTLAEFAGGYRNLESVPPCTDCEGINLFPLFLDSLQPCRRMRSPAQIGGLVLAAGAFVASATAALSS